MEYAIVVIVASGTGGVFMSVSGGDNIIFTMKNIYADILILTGLNVVFVPIVVQIFFSEWKKVTTTF